MDPSVLWCLGPDFDKQTVLSLLGDSNYSDSAFMQPTTPTWWMSSPSQWNTSTMHEPPAYTPRSVMSELGPQSPTNGATKRPFSDLSNRTTSKRVIGASPRISSSLSSSRPILCQSSSADEVGILHSGPFDDTRNVQSSTIVDQTITHDTGAGLVIELRNSTTTASIIFSGFEPRFC
jgi:hypothetical protein